MAVLPRKEIFPNDEAENREKGKKLYYKLWIKLEERTQHPAHHQPTPAHNGS